MAAEVRPGEEAEGQTGQWMWIEDPSQPLDITSALGSIVQRFEACTGVLYKGPPDDGFAYLNFLLSTGQLQGSETGTVTIPVTAVAAAAIVASAPALAPATPVTDAAIPTIELVRATPSPAPVIATSPVPRQVPSQPIGSQPVAPQINIRVAAPPHLSPTPQPTVTVQQQRSPTAPVVIASPGVTTNVQFAPTGQVAVTASPPSPLLLGQMPTRRLSSPVITSLPSATAVAAAPADTPKEALFRSNLANFVRHFEDAKDAERCLAAVNDTLLVDLQSNLSPYAHSTLAPPIPLIITPRPPRSPVASTVPLASATTAAAITNAAGNTVGIATAAGITPINPPLQGVPVGTPVVTGPASVMQSVRQQLAASSPVTALSPSEAALLFGPPQSVASPASARPIYIATPQAIVPVSGAPTANVSAYQRPQPSQPLNYALRRRTSFGSFYPMQLLPTTQPLHAYRRNPNRTRSIGSVYSLTSDRSNLVRL